jgi:hypothetical protein
MSSGPQRRVRVQYSIQPCDLSRPLSTTADVYAHLTPAMGKEVAATMDAILSKRASGA